MIEERARALGIWEGGTGSLVSALPSSVALGGGLYLTELQPPHLQNGNKDWWYLPHLVVVRLEDKARAPGTQ